MFQIKKKYKKIVCEILKKIVLLVLCFFQYSGSLLIFFSKKSSLWLAIVEKANIQPYKIGPHAKFMACLRE